QGTRALLFNRRALSQSDAGISLALNAVAKLIETGRIHVPLERFDRRLDGSVPFVFEQLVDSPGFDQFCNCVQRKRNSCIRLRQSASIEEQRPRSLRSVVLRPGGEL